MSVNIAEASTWVADMIDESASEPLPVDDDLLHPAVEAARRALRDLDDEEVPARLRRVAASSARRLPPPLFASVVRELEDSEWMRDRACRAWAEGDGEDASPEVAASALFLRRPEGWRERLQSVVRHKGEEDLRRGREQLEARLRQAEGDLDRARRYLAEVLAEAERRVAAGAAEAEARAEREDRALVNLRARLERVAADLAETNDDRNRLEEELAGADERIADLRRRLLRARRTAGPTQAGSSSVGWTRSRPVELARLLDQLATSLQGTPDAEGSEEPEAPPFRLPPGVRPDAAEAVSWLLDHERPMTLLVDGHNVAHELADASDAVARRRLELVLGRLRRMAAGPVRIELFFDTVEEPSVREERALTVRFVPSADDAVVDAARSAAGAVVVVTSDREVREAAEELGALGLWSAALAGWARR